MAAAGEVSQGRYRGLVIGCGYLGHRVARSWQDCGWDVAVLTRSVERAADLERSGLAVCVGDVTDLDSLAALPSADVVLFAVGRDRERTSQTVREVSLDGLQNVIDVLEDRVDRFVFVSSTGVYGQADGQWVDEDSATEPSRENGRVLVESESVVRSRFGDRARVMRLAGLYGPGRLISRRETLLAGAVLGGRPDAWLNLTHVDDAARAVVAASSADQEGTWLICDDNPVRRGEYFGRLAELFGAPPPTFDAQRGGSRIDGLGKRCRNLKMKEQLGVSLRYPSFEDGLPSAVGEGSGS